MRKNAKLFIVCITLSLLIAASLSAVTIDLGKSRAFITDYKTIRIDNVKALNNYYWLLVTWNSNTYTFQIKDFGPMNSTERDTNRLATLEDNTSKRSAIEISLTKSVLTITDTTSFRIDNMLAFNTRYWLSVRWNATKNNFAIAGYGAMPEVQTYDEIYGDSKHQYASSIIRTKEGGYIMAGSDDSKVKLVKITDRGGVVWDKTYQRPGGGSSLARQVINTFDGNYIVAGQDTNDGLWLIKTDVNGEIIWDRTYTTNSWDGLGGVCQAYDGGYLILGNIGGSSSKAGTRADVDIWLIKTDGYGNIQWEKEYGGDEYDTGLDIRPTSDGGFIVSGLINSNEEVGDSDVWLLKFNAQGRKIWERTFGSTLHDSGSSAIPTTDGGYIVAGSREFYGGETDIFLIKTDENGIMEE